ncbi:ribonuclease P protein subunit [Candidatus Woesearchaeota archaeon]|jgi:ribonuclease P protein subunit POP4|nr:ribonuclease P protein subunit [Candidatus Woesearchaeota archaeon]MBT7062974.1 ribonuclease P protein subunit [Candidatus Woesearchaeota archaeon]MBT7402791.1 ribonuclease P protein subunit [Candidatus Woesearchaeota archaeon]
MRTGENIVKHELIGLNAKILSSRNSANEKIAGKIVDETTHTLVIEQAGKEKRVFKKCVELAIDLNGEKIIIKGSDLEGRPWDRVKQK